MSSLEVGDRVRCTLRHATVGGVIVEVLAPWKDFGGNSHDQYRVALKGTVVVSARQLDKDTEPCCPSSPSDAES